jgi:hypothetical protein
VPFSNKGELETTVANWLDRSDLTTQIPDFIALCEARIRRVLRQKAVTEHIVLSAASTALEVHVQELRSLRLVTDSPSRDRPLTLGSKERIDDVRASAGGRAGRPTHVAVIDQTVFVAPTPDTDYTAEIVFYEDLDERLADTTSSTATNEVLLDSPDVYLYGTLAAAEPFLKNDERMALWKGLADEAMHELAVQRDRKEFGASMRPVRLSRPIG